MTVEHESSFVRAFPNNKMSLQQIGHVGGSINIKCFNDTFVETKKQ